MKKILLLTLSFSIMATQTSTEQSNSNKEADSTMVTLTKGGTCALAAYLIKNQLAWAAHHASCFGRNPTSTCQVLEKTLAASALAYGAYTVAQSDYRFGKRNNGRNKLIRAAAITATIACILEIYIKHINRPRYY